MSDRYLDRAGLSVAEPLVRFLEDRALPGTGLDSDAFWQGTAEIFARFAPENAALLARRDALQSQIDQWHRERAGEGMAVERVVDDHHHRER